MLRHISRSALAAILLTGACTSDGGPPDENDTGAGKADQISGNDDPSGLLATAERHLAALVGPADVDQTFGLDDAKAPYPDTYWPMVDNGVAVQWAEKSGRSCDTANQCSDPQDSPLAKYMALVDPTRSAEAVAWEVKHHGKDVPDVKDWFGHCPGWTAAAQLFAPVRHATFLKSDGQGGVATCEGSEAGCIKLEIGDVNALAAEAYNNARSSFIGARCDTEPSKIERDADGRIVRNGTGCKGLNAGAMFIVAANMLKLDKQAFGIDAQNEFNTDQIWNQPAYRYTVHRFEPLTEAEAANLVASGSKTGDRTDYIWNTSASGFVLVDFAMQWVTERGPNTTLVSGTDSTNQTRMVAVIELDKAATDATAAIIGGEYLDDESVGANRLTNHPFVWKASAVGPDDGQGHNPFVKGAVVDQIIQLAVGSTSAGTCAHDACTTGAALESGCDSCVTSVCAMDAFCCSDSWDGTCTSEAATTCGLTCP